MKWLKKILLQWLGVNDLVAAYKEKIEGLEKQAPKEIFTQILPPGPDQEREYWRKLSDLLSDPFYVFFLAECRRWAIEGFERSGKDNSEYFRGKLTQVSEIVDLCRSARVKYLTAPVVEKPEE